MFMKKVTCFPIVFYELQEVTEKMLEIIGIVSLDIQREIITCLPDVVEDSEHADVATALRLVSNVI